MLLLFLPPIIHRRREERRVKDLFICREMPANTNLAAFGKGNDHFFTPKGMSGFV
jgi:hypothetical protein